MANTHKHSVQEALNITGGSGGQWTVSTSGTAGSVASDANTIHFTISDSTAQLGIYADVDIRFKFTTGATDDIDVSEDDDMILPAQSLTFLVVPRGLSDTVYFHYISNSTTTGSVRIVQV
tara:strand:- start:1020 stop:1379 length:360 start_codon:yes stop_codon:yes gene_type:complete